MILLKYRYIIRPINYAFSIFYLIKGKAFKKLDLVIFILVNKFYKILYLKYYYKIYKIIFRIIINLKI
jgi:hypothetical protein